MDKILLIIFLLTLSITRVNGECFLCEEINERNKNLPPPKFEYYDDYLESLDNQQEEEVDEVFFESDEEKN